MKSFVIIGAMCFLFIIISDFTDDSKALNTPLKTMQCMNETSSKCPQIVVRKKIKANQMPNWQRVIPGMYR